MADKVLTAAEAEEEFWDHLGSSNTGMLGLDQPGYHSQPMTAFRDEDSGAIWFFTRDDTDLARDAALPDQSALFTYGSKDQEVWASIHGTLSVSHDREKIDRYWNPVVAAWYPEGKDDPHLTLLRFDADDGRIWVSKQGPVRFFYEIAKARLTKTLPDEGAVTDVRLG
ncbi:pyridoxamine 5'-phosphate oxidase family protein [Brevundimonas sp. LjRoot202]|uniref:pyridoxamine 5'-phosphate oxidase family protein n=1 Tax=Brevundimonas sp. LjRoot202 TaxID=3342281 RepID=UPI003ECC408D